MPGIHVLRILTSASVGGPARQIRALSAEFDARAVRQTIVVGRLHPGETELEISGVPGVDVIHMDDIRDDLAPAAEKHALAALQTIVSERRPDLVHTHLTKAGVLGERLVRGTSIPLVHTYHGHDLRDEESWLAGKLRRTLERGLNKKRTAITCVSASCGKELEEMKVLHPGAWSVVEPGLELPIADPKRRARQRARLTLGDDDAIVWCGRLEEVKDPMLILNVLPHLAQATHLAGRPRRAGKLRVCVFGAGSMEGELRHALSQDAPWREHVEVRLMGTDPAFPEAVAAFDALLSTSRREGLPTAALEALAQGVPVVAPRVAGCVDIAGEGVALVDREAQALASALTDVKAPTRARVDEIHRRHRPSKIAGEYCGVYMSALSGLHAQ